MQPGKQKSPQSITRTQKTKVSANQFHIVGIGASAGGFEALEEFFKNMPEGNGMAFVVIQHLDPDHVCIMTELLQRITKMKVIEATDRLKVMPNCVYVIPPNKSMSILKGALHLFEPVETRGLRLPIDIFFRSLADDKQGKSIGIILSGMGSDGSQGIKAIKEKNGFVLVQDPNTAKFDGMPNSATQATLADIIAPAQELPSKLISLLKISPSARKEPIIEIMVRSNIEKIIILLREQTGHDFSLYKKNTLFRRIERRRSIHQIDKIQSYVRFLQENPQETEILYKELLIGVTSFFRDPALWELLKEKIIPDLIKKLPNSYVFRVWIPGCSTGEEAYSMAIILTEIFEKVKKNSNVSLQLFATDLDSDAIEKARKGFYQKNIVADVSPKRLGRFFNDEGDGYRVNSSIREMVVFAPQNVIKDPPFTKLDIISCRNLLIYMEPELQKKLIALFNYSLNAGGIMVLGSAETLGLNKEEFITIDSKLKIFKKSTLISSTELIDFPSSFHRPRFAANETKMIPKNVENIQALADQLLLQQFAPASVLVNDKGDILYITGRTGKYLEPAAGKANWNIYAMAREGLSQVLPSAIRKALQSFDTETVSNIKVGNSNENHLVNVTVQRIENPAALRGMIIIVFTDVNSSKENIRKRGKAGKTFTTEQQREMEIELQRCYEELQSTREEMQTSQEELKSINEELQSTNEELQSTNEELTTSKEEMQSLNEELQTVNIELQSKVNDYQQVNDDMKNLLNSIEIATLFLDKELNIRRFTDQATSIFKLRGADIGRPFTDLVSDLHYTEISEHAKKVLKTLSPIESQVTTNKGNWFNVRIMPYRTIDDRIDGLVMTFTDITIAKKLEIELKVANEGLKKKGK